MGVVKHVAGSSGVHPGDGFLQTFDQALGQHATREQLAHPSTSSKSTIPTPDAYTESPRRAHILHATCRAYTKLNLMKKAEAWCDALLAMSSQAHRMAGEIYSEGPPEVDGWIGKGEALLLREEWEEAVRALERAAEKSGRSNQDVGVPYHLLFTPSNANNRQINRC